MSRESAVEDQVAVVAPQGRDAAVALQLLTRAGLDAAALPSIDALTEALRAGIATAVVTEEALAGQDLRPLFDWVAGQPEWSDFPFVVLLRPNATLPSPLLDRDSLERLGNVTLLERPLSSRTLLTAVAAALRGRRRQYAARRHMDDLLEAQDNLALALAAGRLGAWTLSVPDMTLSSTAQCKENYGRSPDDEFGFRTLQASIVAEDRPRMEAAVAAAVEHGTTLSLAYRTRTPDGDVRWIEITGKSRLDEHGRVRHLAGVSADITEQHHAADERERLLEALARERFELELRVGDRTADLQRANEALQSEILAKVSAQEQLLQTQKVETMGQLVGGVAHDFNNILMIITANLALLRRRCHADDKAIRLLDIAKRGADRGAQLTQRLLAYARRQDLQPESVDPGGLLEELSPLIERSVGPLVEIRLHKPPTVLPVLVDPAQLEMVILNLAINARDAMTGSGRLDIEIVDDDDGQQAPGGLAPGRYVRLSVTDNGAGMDAATLARATEPFFSTKGIGKGTGLGLSMVQGFAKQSGGSFQLLSEPGRGTTAILWLPMSDAPPSDKGSARPVEIAAGTGHVLVVDDDASVAASTAAMLEAIGYRVTEVHDGHSALARLRDQQPIDMVVTDYAMPGLNGLDLARQIGRERPGLPVLLVTGFADHMGRETFTVPKLAKPFTIEQLSGALAALQPAAPSP